MKPKLIPVYTGDIDYCWALATQQFGDYPVAYWGYREVFCKHHQGPPDGEDETWAVALTHYLSRFSLFEKLLLNTYAGNVNSYSGEQVQYTKERRKGKFAEVQTKIIAKKLEIPLAYRLVKKSSHWWIYDVVIDGISLVRNFRGQFGRIIKAKGFSGLLDKLRIKAEKKI